MDVLQSSFRSAKSRLARFAPLLGLFGAIFASVLVVSIGSAHVPRHSANAVSEIDLRVLNRLEPQAQAEALLEEAIGQSDRAVDQISSRMEAWQGKLTWDSQISALTTAALSSDDLRVRGAAIQVELAAYGLNENAKSVEYVLKTSESRDHARKIWALWALGLMGNRGIEPAHVVQVLTAHLHDSDEDSRRWSVEGLALIGADQTIPILLRTMHDDPASGVRERAASALAQTGMFTRDQRISAVPQLLNYTDDPSLDSQTHAWAFQALGQITRQHLPADSTAWREWYQSANKE
ncbi:MAG TPA: HEAT repeat domain-containing protein [Verrucomicrobiae bacterium]|jgi:HEAT repeat protein|nr:HEAT repeat domain-containing protein [Verrucomicrobiae bacterium]